MSNYSYIKCLSMIELVILTICKNTFGKLRTAERGRILHHFPQNTVSGVFLFYQINSNYIHIKKKILLFKIPTFVFLFVFLVFFALLLHYFNASVFLFFFLMLLPYKRQSLILLKTAVAFQSRSFPSRLTYPTKQQLHISIKRLSLSCHCFSYSCRFKGAGECRTCGEYEVVF